jgi:molecular chaperone GrpE
VDESVDASVDESDIAAELARERDQLRRALADLDNLRKRFARELERARATERDAVTVELVEIVDDLERALGHADADASTIVAGVEALHDRAVAGLARLGYRRFGEPGEKFDPVRHEAVGSTDATDEPPGTVAHLVRPGYERNGEVVRPAAVIVAK